MNSPLNRLKVPYGFYRAANEAGLLKLVKFYYQLKEYSVHGHFLDKTFVDFCVNEKKLFKSVNTAKDYRAKLLKNKFAFLKHGRIFLRKYEQIWSVVGTPQEKHLKRSYKIFYTTNSAFVTDNAFHTVNRTLSAQKQELLKEHLQRTEGVNAIISTSQKSSALSTLEKKKLCLSKQVRQLRNHLFQPPKINYQVTISCQGIAELLGYKSKMQGSKILRGLKKLGLIKIKKQKAVLICAFGYDKPMPDNSKFFRFRNAIYQRLPNLVSIA